MQHARGPFLALVVPQLARSPAALAARGQRRALRVRPAAGALGGRRVRRSELLESLLEVERLLKEASDERRHALTSIEKAHTLLHEAAVMRKEAYETVTASHEHTKTMSSQIEGYIKQGATRVGQWSWSHLSKTWYKFGWTGVAVGVCLVIGIGFAVTFFRQPLAREAAELGTAAVKDPKFLQEVEDKLQALVHAILHDDQSKRDVIVLLTRLIQDPNTHKVLLELLDRLLRADVTSEALKALLLRDKTLEAVRELLVRQETKDGAKKLLTQLFEDEELHKKAGVFIRGTSRRTFLPWF